MEQAGIGIVGLVLVGVALQRRYVTAVAVTPNGAALGKCGLRESFDGSLIVSLFICLPLGKSLLLL